jgi:hypothetical protein
MDSVAALVYTVKCCEFLNRASITFSRRNLHHGVSYFVGYLIVELNNSLFYMIFAMYVLDRYRQ